MADGTLGPVRLLALDLDGTLLSPHGGIDPRDVQAIHHAMDAGITVTLATGRISTGALDTARQLGLRAPIVCAEGAVIADPVTGAVIELRALSSVAVESMLIALGDHGLSPFWFTHDEVHGESAGAAHVHYVGTWSPKVTLHPSLRTSPAWNRRGEIAMALGVGEQSSVETAHARVSREHPEAVMAITFQVVRSDAWALFTRASAVDKAVGLARVAALLGYDRTEVAVVGDWINDVPMFQWAGRSYVMGHAPAHVAAHATVRLTATQRTGGGVAEAIASILAEPVGVPSR